MVRGSDTPRSFSESGLQQYADEGYQNSSPANRCKPLSLKDRGVSLPRTMGHETVGEVVGFGPDAKAVAGDLKVGDVALVYPWLGCGKCDVCLAGKRTCA